MNRKPTLFTVISLAATLLLSLGCASVGRKLLYYPTHRPADGNLAPWTKGGALIGFARQVESPKNIWLLLPGNGGQASDRTYAISSFSAILLQGDTGLEVLEDLFEMLA